MITTEILKHCFSLVDEVIIISNALILGVELHHLPCWQLLNDFYQLIVERPRS